MIDAHCPCAAFDRVAQRHVKVAEDAAIDGGFRRFALHRGESPFLRLQHGERLGPGPGDRDVSAYSLIVRTCDLLEVLQLKFIAADGDGVADVHLHVALGLIARHDRDAGDEHRDANVRQLHAVITAGQGNEPRQDICIARLNADTTDEVLDGRGDDPHRQQ